MRIITDIHTAKEHKNPFRAIREIRSLSLFPSAVSDRTERRTQVLKHLKKFTYSQARQQLSAVLDTARKEEVVITRRGGDSFRLSYRKTAKSPFDVPGVTTGASTQDILNAVRESRDK